MHFIVSIESIDEYTYTGSSVMRLRPSKIQSAEGIKEIPDSYHVSHLRLHDSVRLIFYHVSSHARHA
jgi:hypothetical protein